MITFPSSLYSGLWPSHFAASSATAPETRSATLGHQTWKESLLRCSCIPHFVLVERPLVSRPWCFVFPIQQCLHPGDLGLRGWWRRIDAQTTVTVDHEWVRSTHEIQMTMMIMLQKTTKLISPVMSHPNFLTFPNNDLIMMIMIIVNCDDHDYCNDLREGVKKNS